MFNGDTAYITQPKQQKSERCYYVGARWRYAEHCNKSVLFLNFSTEQRPSCCSLFSYGKYFIPSTILVTFDVVRWPYRSAVFHVRPHQCLVQIQENRFAFKLDCVTDHSQCPVCCFLCFSNLWCCLQVWCYCDSKILFIRYVIIYV